MIFLIITDSWVSNRSNSRLSNDGADRPADVSCGMLFGSFSYVLVFGLGNDSADRPADVSSSMLFRSFSHVLVFRLGNDSADRPADVSTGMLFGSFSHVLVFGLSDDSTDWFDFCIKSRMGILFMGSNW